MRILVSMKTYQLAIEKHGLYEHHVTYGRGKGIVIGTGHNTEIGKIATAIEEIQDESTPLQQKLDQLGKWLGSACLVICLLVFVVGVMRQNMLEMFMVAISLAVAAIPEGYLLSLP